MFRLFGKKNKVQTQTEPQAMERRSAAPLSSSAASSLPGPDPTAAGACEPGAAPEGLTILTTGDTDTTLETEEAAILFANGQIEVAERMLLAATEDAPGSPARPLAWWMLFDLYQASAQPERFEALSLAYARRFERSPPVFTPAGPDTQASGSVRTSLPVISFSGVLDDSVSRQIERLHRLRASHPALRLDFSRVTAVTASGCELLEQALYILAKAGFPLLLSGAEAMPAQIRRLIQDNNPAASNACWLLLLEILRLQNQPQAFEDASMEYCIAFEVSPPTFVAPAPPVEDLAASADAAPPATSPAVFVMPPILEGPLESLMAALARHIVQHESAVLDCSRLKRVDFNAAGQLLNCLAPLAGRAIELQHVSHLVATLFEVIGLKDLVRIVPRKH